ncbi:hypothetical protein FM106_15495 [Brachybacterium faecium]|nr:hypothetical protein FM106_15495 [Brachybacterium faecium]
MGALGRSGDRDRSAVLPTGVPPCAGGVCGARSADGLSHHGPFGRGKRAPRSACTRARQRDRDRREARFSQVAAGQRP